MANLAKGGVVKLFDRRDARLLVNDAGVIGRLADGRLVTSQWIDAAHQVQVTDDGWEVSEQLNVVPTHKMLTPLKNILFRTVLVCLGWSPRFSHWLKGAIRRTLMLGARPVAARFRRRFVWDSGRAVLQDEVRLDKGFALPHWRWETSSLCATCRKAATFRAWSWLGTVIR